MDTLNVLRKCIHLSFELSTVLRLLRHLLCLASPTTPLPKRPARPLPKSCLYCLLPPNLCSPMQLLRSGGGTQGVYALRGPDVHTEVRMIEILSSLTQLPGSGLTQGLSTLSQVPRRGLQAAGDRSVLPAAGVLPALGYLFRYLPVGLSVASVVAALPACKGPAKALGKRRKGAATADATAAGGAVATGTEVGASDAAQLAPAPGAGRARGQKARGRGGTGLDEYVDSQGEKCGPKSDEAIDGVVRRFVSDFNLNPDQVSKGNDMPGVGGKGGKAVKGAK